MRVGIFSDIHGNIGAFDRVWKALLNESCDMYFCVGDLCGYYYAQNEVIEAVQHIDGLVCVLGNHDQLFLECLEDGKKLKEYSSKYGGSLSFLKDTITPGHLEYLRGLPLFYENKELGLAMYHGSPWNALNEYIYPTDPADRFKGLDHKYVLLGHTHHPMHKRIGNVQVINPGSVGQPRDHSQAAFAVLDLDKDAVSFKRVSYDIGLLVEDLKRRDEKNVYLFDVLKRKKSG